MPAIPLRCRSTTGRSWSHRPRERLGIRADPGCVEGSRRSNGGGGLVLYTDGLTEARHGGQLFGLEGATAALEGLDKPSPTEAIGVLRARSSEFADGILTDDTCLLAARIT